MIDQFNSIFIEFCTCCDKHECTCQSTTPSKYTHYFNLLKLAIENLCAGFVVYANTNPLSGKKYAPTVGAFEVFFRGNLIFSKINKKIWPSIPNLVKRIVSIKEATELTEARAGSRSTSRNGRVITRPRTTQSNQMPYVGNLLTLNHSPLNSTAPHITLGPQSVDRENSFIYEDEQYTGKSAQRPRRINFSSEHADKNNKSVEKESPNTLDERYLIRPVYNKKRRPQSKNHGALDITTITDRRFKQFQRGHTHDTTNNWDLSVGNNSFYYPISEIGPVSNQRARTPWSVFTDHEENNLFATGGLKGGNHNGSNTRTNISEWDRPDGYGPTETINTRLTLSRGQNRGFSGNRKVKIPQIDASKVIKRNPTIPESTQRGREKDGPETGNRGNLSSSLTSRVRNGSISDMPFPKNKVSYIKIPRDEIVKKKITITGESGGDAVMKIYTDVPQIINMETNEVVVPKGGMSKVSLRFYNLTGNRPESFNLFLFKNGKPYQKIVIYVEYL